MTGLNVSSVYRKSQDEIRKILQENNITKILVDIQDCGVRLYTFVWTLYDVMNATDRNITIVVFDRPNPLGGDIVEGPVLERKLYSRYGKASVPHRHGLTIGELAKMFAHEMKIEYLRVVKMNGWQRSFTWAQTKLPFIPPSPNLPTSESVRRYVSTVFLEASTISEGRGTTIPFSTFGAPWFGNGSNAVDLTRELNEKCCEEAAACFRTNYYIPTWFKYNGSVVGGVQWIDSSSSPASFAVTSELVLILMRSSNESFRWDGSWFGWGDNTTLIDLYSGTSRFREALLLDGVTGDDVAKLFQDESDTFRDVTRLQFLLY